MGPRKDCGDSREPAEYLESPGRFSRRVATRHRTRQLLPDYDRAELGWRHGGRPPSLRHRTREQAPLKSGAIHSDVVIDRGVSDAYPLRIIIILPRNAYAPTSDPQVLRNAVITIDDDALGKSLKIVQHVMGAEGRWSRTWSLRCKAALEFAGHALGGFMDR